MLTLGQRSQRGVTIVEMLIGLAIIALLTVMAVPAYNTWLQNSQIRNAAESVVNATNIARAEAVQRNTPTELRMGPGSSWAVILQATGTQVQERPAAEGSVGVAVVINDLDGDGTADNAADRVTFNGMGWRVANADASPTISQLDFSNPTGGTCKHVNNGAMRCMRVVIQAAGATRMCDPAVAIGDPRAC
jgi:type IV fimbrial biogenesis protein FimT